MAPTTTIDSPLDGASESVPFIVSGTVTPPGAVWALWDDTTGQFLGAIQSDAAGHAQLVVASVLSPGALWPMAESPSGSFATLTTASAVAAFTGLSVALAAARAGLSAGLSGAELAASISAAYAAWAGRAAATGLGVSQSASVATLTTASGVVQAQLTGLGVSASAAVGAVAAALSGTGSSASSGVGTASLTVAAGGGTAPPLLTGFPKTTNGGAGYRTAIVSPSVDLTGQTNVKLTAVVSWIEDVGSAGTTTLSGLGLTWTAGPSSVSSGCGVRIFTAWAATAPAAGTITAAFQNANKACDVTLAVYAHTGAAQTNGASATNTAANQTGVAVTAAANSQIVFGAASATWGLRDALVAAGCTSDITQYDTDGSSYWYSTGAGHRSTATASAGSFTVGYNVFADGDTSPLVQVALEIKAG